MPNAFTSTIDLNPPALTINALETEDLEPETDVPVL